MMEYLSLQKELQSKIKELVKSPEKSEITDETSESLNILFPLEKFTDEFIKSRDNVHNLVESLYSTEGKDLFPYALDLEKKATALFKNAETSQENLTKYINKILKISNLKEEQKEKLSALVKKLSASKESLENMKSDTFKTINELTKSKGEPSLKFKEAQRSLKISSRIDKACTIASKIALVCFATLLTISAIALFANPATGPAAALALTGTILSKTCFIISSASLLTKATFGYYHKKEARKNLSSVMLQKKVKSFSKDKKQEDIALKQEEPKKSQKKKIE